MTLKLLKPEPSLAKLYAIARSGMSGSVQARAEIKRRKIQQLRQELGS